ncbi:sugar ABC transporter permease [Salinisphaera sp. USBA-960]|uniref:carbohydrate ABC transporter permease n=1 Tax=Salinisphaera orenii TaxID=856731 RepID=UPI000DBEA616|nr:sugar ABC transporter permease [Salifodinibacter halophilus]NNC26965.1 sugar ABC transporter permease [Salifodinibacter halophilus]
MATGQIPKERKQSRFELAAWSDWLLPKLTLIPSLIAVGVFIYGFLGWTIWLSFTNSTILPSNHFAGLIQYEAMFSLDTWHVSLLNLLIFGALYIGVSLGLGLLLAILLDQKIRAVGLLRTIYLYPMALSMVVTGVVWKWMLNPSMGVQHVVRSWGWGSFSFDWLIQPDMAIYAVAVAAVWQASGFVMTLFLAGLRNIDDSIIKAAQLDGASLPRAYLKIIIPSLQPVLFSAVALLVQLSIKSFALIMAMTGGGPGYSTWMPAIFMYEYGFNRGQIALGAAAASLMMLVIAVVILPMWISEFRQKRNARNG